MLITYNIQTNIFINRIMNSHILFYFHSMLFIGNVTSQTKKNSTRVIFRGIFEIYLILSDCIISVVCWVIAAVLCYFLATNLRENGLWFVLASYIFLVVHGMLFLAFCPHA